MFNYINLSLQSNNKDSSNTDNFYIKINDEYIFSYILNNVDSDKNIEILGEYGFILINNKPIELDEIYKNGTYMQNQIKMQSYSPLLIKQNYLEIINNELWVDKIIVDNYISKINNFKVILSITKRINSELLSNYNNNLYGKNNFNLQFLSYTFLVDINSYDSGRNKYKCILLEDTNFNPEFCNNSNIYLTGYNEIEINKNGILNWYIEVLKTNNL